MSSKLIGNMYFVNAGQRTGQFLVFIEFDKEKKIYSVLGLPESEVVFIGEKDVDSAMTAKLLGFVQTLPKDVFTSCKNEFKYREINK